MLLRSLVKRRASRRPFPVAVLASVLPSFVLPVLPPCACWSSRSLAARRLRMGPTHATPVRGSPCQQLRTTSEGTAGGSEKNYSIMLTKKEAEIFELLGRVLQDEQLSNLTLRVAGGWVRDKILGREMEEVDIDIALDTLLGREFAEIVNNWMEKNGYTTASVGVIQRNPDQSKHLETATMRVLDVWLDLVNLRTETYTADSRIPEMAIGTPREDAMRRDLTINALFYNINTGVVEDFTGRGFDDIRARLVRTPLPPLTTLLDDPLRALRAIRFASRLNFRFDSELYAACQNPDVRDALSAKVSRERIETEIDKIMASDRPVHALGLLVELGLFTTVFRLPATNDGYLGDMRPPQNLPCVALGSLINLEALWNLSITVTSPLLRRLTTPPEDTRLAAYAALLVSIANVVCVGRKRKPVPAVQHVLGTELKMSTRDVAAVVGMHTAAVRFRELVRRHADNAEMVTRLAVGRVLRDAGPEWRIALQVALADELASGPVAESYVEGVDEKRAEIPGHELVVVEHYAQFMLCVEKFELEGVWNLKPAIDGREVLELLPGLRKGPQVGEIMKRQIEWMIENPYGSVEGARQWLLSSYQDLTAR